MLETFLTARRATPAIAECVNRASLRHAAQAHLDENLAAAMARVMGASAPTAADGGVEGSIALLDRELGIARAEGVDAQGQTWWLSLAECSADDAGLWSALALGSRVRLMPDGEGACARDKGEVPGHSRLLDVAVEGAWIKSAAPVAVRVSLLVAAQSAGESNSSARKTIASTELAARDAQNTEEPRAA